MSENHEAHMRRAIELSQEGMDGNAGGPFGAVIVKEGGIIGEGFNQGLPFLTPQHTVK